MAKIFAPNKDYTGTSAGVSFAKGEGETEDKWRIEWFKNKGYEVVEEEGKKDDNPENDKPVEKMTHEELDAFAAEKEIPEEDYPASGNKEEKATAINEFLSGE